MLTHMTVVSFRGLSFDRRAMHISARDNPCVCHRVYALSSCGVGFIATEWGTLSSCNEMVAAVVIIPNLPDS